MAKKNKIAHQAVPKNKTLSINSADAQNPRLLGCRQTGPEDTVSAEGALYILKHAAPVKGLRVHAAPLQTPRIKLNDDYGRPHLGVVLHYFGAQIASNIAACNERNAIQLGG
jgi:hypothetical protein